jgi:plasmid stabilization system protein ParE
VPRRPEAAISAPARQDIRHALEWIARSSGRARAEPVLQRLLASAERYAEMPLAGRARDEIDAGVRSFVAMRWNVLYRPLARGIVLLRVIDGSRDMARALQEQSAEDDGEIADRDDRPR